MKDRIKAAIEFLKHDQSFLVDDLRLSINKTGDLQVTGWSQYIDFRNLNKAVCLDELNEVKQMFSDMLSSSEDLRRFVKDKAIRTSVRF